MKQIILRQNKKYSIKEVCLVAEEKAEVVIEKDVLESVEKNFQAVKKLFNKNVYGLTTGVADLSGKKPESTDVFQKNILLSHSVGVGENLPKETVRAAIFSRLIVLSKGMSGVNSQLILFMQDMLNKDVIPLVPTLGSIGASDLTILAGIFATLCNKGSVLYKNKLLKPYDGFRKAGVKYPKNLQTREGLALINGNSAAVGFTCILTEQIEDFVQESLESAAFSLEARGATYAVFNNINQDLKKFVGQKRAAKTLEKLLQNSQQIYNMYEVKKRIFLQDPPSFKTVVQIFGNVFDTITSAKKIVTIELNSVTDNPLFVAEEKEIKPVSSGNYICAQLATIFDQLSLCLSSIASTSVARMKILLNEKYNEGLPAYLIKDNSNNSGFMITVYTAESVLSEVKALLYPRSVFDITVANGWEDISSNAFNVVQNTLRIFNLTKQIVVIEKKLALQALALRKERNPMLKLSKNSRKAFRRTSIKLPITTDQETSDFLLKGENK